MGSFRSMRGLSATADGALGEGVLAQRTPLDRAPAQDGAKAVGLREPGGQVLPGQLHSAHHIRGAAKPPVASENVLKVSTARRVG